MKLWLGRHSDAGPTATDPQVDRSRALTPEGVAMAQAMAKRMFMLEWRPHVILASPFKRTMETAYIYGRALATPVQSRDELQPHLPLDTFVEWLVSDEDVCRVMIVGHHDNIMPMLQKLAGSTDDDKLAKGEVRYMKAKRKSGKMRERQALRPSQVGFQDEY